MSMAEALTWLWFAREALISAGHGTCADDVAEAALRLEHMHMKSDMEAYATHILPNGKRGHIKLVLRSPVGARTLAFIAAIARSIE